MVIAPTGPSCSTADLRAQMLALRDALNEALGDRPDREVDEISVGTAAASIALSHRRAKVFGRDARMFGDPAWEMLLDLYVNRLRNVSVSSVCLASGVAPTTALRWLSSLEQRGFVARSPDPTDGRRQFLHLTSEAVQLIEAVFRR